MPSVTFMYCLQTAKDIVKLLSRPGRAIILVFQPNRRKATQLQRLPNCKPIQQGVKYTAVHGNICVLDCNRRLSRKRYDKGPQLL